MICISKDGKRHEQNLLTEQGLYNVIFRSRTEIGKRFRKFVTEILKTLRKRGQISIDKLIYDLTDKIKLQNDFGKNLYIIAEKDGWYKIGRSKCEDNRLKKLQTGNPECLTVYRAFENKGKFENTVHLKAYTLSTANRSEWFKINDIQELVDWIETL